MTTHAVRGRRLAAATDLSIAVALLSELTVHAHRDQAELATWAQRAMHFGRTLTLPTARTVVSPGGIRDGHVLLACFHSRPDPLVEVFSDSLALAEQTVAQLGWPDLFPPGSIAVAAVAHERAHHAVHDPRVRRALRRAMAVPLFPGVRRSPTAWIAGADELAAHAAATQAAGLPRSTLLLNQALQTELSPARGRAA